MCNLHLDHRSTCRHSDQCDAQSVHATAPTLPTARVPLDRFFEDYKKNENKEVKVDEFLGAEVARKTVLESMVSACPVKSAVMSSILPLWIHTWDSNHHHLLLAKHDNIQWPSLTSALCSTTCVCMHVAVCVYADAVVHSS